MRFWVIAWKEFRQLRRDRATLAMMVILPVMQLLLFGYAINTDVRHIPLVIMDNEKSTASRDLARSLQATTFYDIVGYVQHDTEMQHALQSGVAKAVLVIPSRYSSAWLHGETAQVQLILDGSDPQTVGSALNTAASLVQARASELLLKSCHSFAPLLPINLEPMVWYNPDLRTSIYIVPGLIGVILTMTMVMLTSMAIVRERERGTFEQLIVSPVKNIELMVGKILPYVMIGYVQISLILLAGRLIFGVPFVGSLTLLYGLSFVFISANLALGLFFSTLAHTQQQAMQMSFFFMLPNILLSGFMFPFEAMPGPAQMISQILPLTHFLRIVRGITLKGSGFQEISIEFIWLCGLLISLIAMASLRFSKKLD